MPPSPSDQEDARDHTPQKTLAELFFRFDKAHLRRELEEFRIKYEAEFGESDLTKRYTSTLPGDQQDYLLVHHPERYWEGLPTFLQAFLREKMLAIHKRGELDDAPSHYLRLYLRGKMTVHSDNRPR